MKFTSCEIVLNAVNTGEKDMVDRWASHVKSELSKTVIAQIRYTFDGEDLHFTFYRFHQPVYNYVIHDVIHIIHNGGLATSWSHLILKNFKLTILSKYIIIP